MSTTEKESLFSTKNLGLLVAPLSKSNPVTILVLGVCSALAVTVKVEPAVVMALSVIVVTGLSNLIISLLRNSIPSRIRIIVQLVVVAALVILVDQCLKAFLFQVSKQLSVFVGLIITNCIVMGRLEAFALSNKPLPSLLDGLGNGLGYGFVIVIVGFFRELLGNGTVWNIRVIPESWYMNMSDVGHVSGYMNNGFTLLPPMALILLGIIIWIQRSVSKSLIK